jgi:hypothetical protein
VTRAVAAVRAPKPAVPARLRRLAVGVERLSGSARCDPEQQLAEQEAIVATLQAMTKELEQAR